MSDVLQRILARKREEVAAARAAKSRTELEAAARARLERDAPRGFVAAIERRLAAGEPAREGDGGRVAAGGRLVDHRAAGIAHAEQPGHLVVGLTRRIVDGGSHLGDGAGDVVDHQQ